MPYVSRDENRKIIGISKTPRLGMDEFLPDGNPELMQALKAARPQIIRKKLENNKKKLGCLAEDLMYILMEKNILNFTDLPYSTQQLFYEQRQLQEELDQLEKGNSEE